jgi:hypothetical protein
MSGFDRRAGIDFDRADLGTQGLDLRIVHRRITEFFRTGMTPQQTDGHRVLGEL